MRSSLERTLPHAVDAEKAILGAILVNNEHVHAVVGKLVAEDFYIESHRKIYRAILDLLEHGQAADLITLQDALLQRMELESAGGIVYLSGLTDGVPFSVHLEHYVEIVKKKSTLRQLIMASNKIMADCFDAVDDVDDIVGRAEQAILDLTQSRLRGGFVSAHELEVPTVRLLERLYQEREMITGVASGFIDLDRMTSGFHPGELVIIAARPSAGKTSFALNIMQHAALRSGLTVGMFSLEMAKEQLMMRLLCAEARVDAHKVRTGYIGHTEFTRLIDCTGVVGGAPIYIDDSSALTVLEMRSKARRLQAERGLSMVIVDYLQLMSGVEKKENRVQEVSSISRGLKMLAKELNVPVLALSQLSRAPEQRTGNHIPQLSDLRESGSIEQDSDTVLFLYREEMYNPSEENAGLAKVIIGKQRNGPTGEVSLAFLREYTRFESLLAIT